MRRRNISILCAAALMSLAACGQEGGDENRAAAADNMQAANDMAVNDPSNPFAQSEMDMHDRMMAARGTDVSETWARKMIEHHRGAVAMSEILLQQDPNSRFAPMARTTVEEQTAEIQRLEQMIQNAGAATQPAATAPTTAPASPASQPKAELKTEPKSQPKTAPKAAPKAATPPADPHAGHDMNNM